MEQIPEFLNEIEQFGWTLEAPTSITSDTAKFIFVRHAMSEYNYRAYKCKSLYTDKSPEFASIMTDRRGCDPGLHPIGIA